MAAKPTMTQDLRRLYRLAQLEGCSVGYLIRRAIREHVECCEHYLLTKAAQRQRNTNAAVESYLARRRTEKRMAAARHVRRTVGHY